MPDHATPDRAAPPIAGRVVARVVACKYAKTGATYIGGSGRVLDVWRPMECDWPEPDYMLPEYVKIEFTDGASLLISGACHDESRVELEFSDV